MSSDMQGKMRSDLRDMMVRLGYDPDKFVFVREWVDEIEEATGDASGWERAPASCHVLAKWKTDAITVHFDVPNRVEHFFDAFDEVGDPSAVVKIWCCDADDASGDRYIDTDSDESIDWLEVARKVSEPN